MKAREAVFVSLQKYETGSKYLNIEADAAIRRNALQGADRALYTALLYGTVERRITLDYILSLLSDRPLEQIDPNIRRILRLSLYQLCYMDRIPAYAVLYDAGALTRRFARNDAVPFVNAVLRAYLRRKATLPFPKQTEDPIQYLSITYAYPAWLCDLFVRQYGLSRTEKILHGFSVPPTLTLFTNTQRLSREELLRRLMQDGIDAIPTTYSPYGVRLREHVPLSEISPLQQGLCFVQDEASQIAACALGALPGDTVLDACACPGGKSFATALCMQNRGTLIACDLHENKRWDLTVYKHSNGTAAYQIQRFYRPSTGFFAMFRVPGLVFYPRSRIFGIKTPHQSHVCRMCKKGFWMPALRMSSRVARCYMPPVPSMLQKTKSKYRLFYSATRCFKKIPFPSVPVCATDMPHCFRMKCPV